MLICDFNVNTLKNYPNLASNGPVGANYSDLVYPRQDYRSRLSDKHSILKKSGV